jgi:hypothetical protein
VILLLSFYFLTMSVSSSPQSYRNRQYYSIRQSPGAMSPGRRELLTPAFCLSFSPEGGFFFTPGTFSPATTENLQLAVASPAPQQPEEDHHEPSNAVAGGALPASIRPTVQEDDDDDENGTAADQQLPLPATPFLDLTDAASGLVNLSSPRPATPATSKTKYDDEIVDDDDNDDATIFADNHLAAGAPTCRAVVNCKSHLFRTPTTATTSFLPIHQDEHEEKRSVAHNKSTKRNHHHH